MSLYKDASLVMIPSAYKDGKLYSIRPTDGDGDFTFSRGSNLAATRVDVNGLIEKGRENRLLQSNTFSNAAWSKTNASVTSGQGGYDGSSDAWLLTKTAASGRVFQNLSASGVLTYSVYMKANASTWGLIQVDGSPNDAYVYVDLSIGVLGSVSSHNITESLEDVGNGWYRVSLSLNDTATRVRIYPAETNSASATSGSIYIQDAQLEAGLVATDYIETTSSTAQAGILEDMPRLDYSGGASCPALLLEPQRSNLITQSEHFADSSWTKLGSGTASTAIVTSNYAISPEGLQNASRLQCDLNGGTTISDQSLIYDTITGSGDTSAFIYVKSNTGSNQNFYLANTLNDRITAVATTEWKKFDLNWDAVGNGRSLSIGSRGTTGSDDTLDLLIWGAQVEAASYPTSYIPTYGASVTRSNDVCVNSSLTTSTDFTIFFEAPDFCLINGSTGGSYDSVQFVFSADGNPYSASGSYHIYNNTLYHNNGSGGNQGFGNIYNNQTDSKFVIMKRGDKVLVFANGTKKTEATLPSGGLYENWDTINLTQSLQDGQGDVFNPYYKQVVKFDTALTDSECIALTTL